MQIQRRASRRHTAAGRCGLRVAILWTHLSGYLNASLLALAAVPGVELYVAHQAAASAAPFEAAAFAWLARRYEYEYRPDVARLLRDLQAFAPDIILASWHVKAFQQCCAHFHSRAVRVACADNQWRGTVRQRLGKLASPWRLRKFYDAIFVAGERQAVWAAHMGFRQDRIWRGLYAAEVDSFAAAAPEPSEPAFLFAGRLSAEKGIATLAAAYQAYFNGSQSPWSCVVAGTGPMGALLDHPGFVKAGFVQPADLPRLFARAACFVLPSLFEPWGVVLAEAAASGLPIICTAECGASVHLVQDNYNGYVVDAGNTSQLAAAMSRMAALPRERWAQMSRASQLLAQQFTPQRWAATVIEKGGELKKAVR